MTSKEALIEYLETRIKGLNILLMIHGNREYLVVERAICCLQLDYLKLG